MSPFLDSSICASSVPDPPKISSVSTPVSCSNAAAISVMAGLLADPQKMVMEPDGFESAPRQPTRAAKPSTRS